MIASLLLAAIWATATTALSSSPSSSSSAAQSATRAAAAFAASQLDYSLSATIRVTHLHANGTRVRSRLDSADGADDDGADRKSVV